jgi:chemotaxis receptor (MCP) glutamine deamidase CheD
VSHPKEITLHVGGVHASAEPTVISTLLGSCVAVCLWDAQVGVGGMNHFLLPEPGAGTSLDDEPTRFGAHAMDRLIGEMLKLGAAPSRFVVKVFGGASVLAIPGASASIPRANIEFVRSYLAREGLTVAATSVGGTLPRQIRFHTDSGKVLVRRVGTPDARAAIAEEERAERRQRRRFGDVTLFGGPRG